VTLAMPTDPRRFAWGILLVNVVGCLVVGAVTGVLRARPGVPDGVRLFLVVGVCGGLTTFSTWMVTDVLLVRDGASATALADVLVSLIAGIFAVWLGFRVVRSALGEPRDRGPLDVRKAD
jgi:CrcB protein